VFLAFLAGCGHPTYAHQRPASWSGRAAGEARHPSLPAILATPVEDARRPVEDGSYPVAYAPLGATAQEARKQEFLNRNGSGWSRLRLDDFGFIAEIAADDVTAPKGGAGDLAFTVAEQQYWQDLIVRNADLFGVDDPASLTLVVDALGQEQRLRFPQRVNNWTVANIWVFKSVKQTPADGVTVNLRGHFWPGAVLPSSARMSRDAVVGEVAGSVFAFTDEEPWFPCDPVSREDIPCASPPAQTRREVVLKAADLDVTVHPYLVRWDETGPLAMRLVYQVDVALQSGGSPPIASPPGWPKLFDAVTGEDLAEATWVCAPDAPATNCVDSLMQTVNPA
jgi:hypothetical protein